jgi:hypothetical protein
MLDTDTFVTSLYVAVDDFCQSHLLPAVAPGLHPALTRSEVVTLALFSQWAPFASERDFYRWALRHLRGAFPRLPDRSQFNRAVRRQQHALVAFGHFLAEHLDGPDTLYEALDTTAVPTRNLHRRGAGGLAGQADIGWSNRLGWFEGLRLLLSVTPAGAITGFGTAPASTKDQPLAETFCALRQQPHPPLPSVGKASPRPYVADKGFGGRHLRAHWEQAYEATVIAASQRRNRQQPQPWPKEWRRWVAGLRQIVETVNTKLQHCFRLDRERPHLLAGLLARLAAKMALHNFCLWLNGQLGRPLLAFVDLVAW